MSTVREDIQGWITERLADVESEGSVSLIGLQHFNGNGHENTIFEMKTGVGKWGDPDAMTNSFYNFAQRHARGLTGHQNFQLAAVYGASGPIKRVLPFGLAGVLHFGSVSGGASTEPPTMSGQTSQGMRLAEQVVQGMISQINPTFRVQADLIDRLMRWMSEVKHENTELWIACKQLLLDLDKRRHDEKMSELTAARMAEFQKQVMALAPSLLNMMAGKEVFPLSTADTSLIDGIAAWVSPEDLQGYTAMLATRPGGDKLAALLTDRFEMYHKRRQAEAQAEKKLLADLPGRSTDEAEQDAMGLAIKALRGHQETVEPVKALTPGMVDRAFVEIQQVSETPQASKNEDTALVDDLFARVPPGQVEMLISVLGASDPDLGERLRARAMKAQG